MYGDQKNIYSSIVGDNPNVRQVQVNTEEWTNQVVNLVPQWTQMSVSSHRYLKLEIKERCKKELQNMNNGIKESHSTSYNHTKSLRWNLKFWVL